MTKMLKRFSVLCVALLIGTFLCAGSPDSAQTGSNAAIKVMTYNVDEGTDFVEVLSATTFPDFLTAVQLTLNNVKATNPPVRMRAIAHQITTSQPDFVGLQEVTTWRVGPGPNPTPVLFDMLQELLDALAAEGQHYVPVVVVPEFELQAPLPDLTTWVKASNRDVLLAKSEGGGLQLSNVQSGHYSTLLTFPTFLGPLTITRGWGFVDATLHGQSLRFIVTHVENFVAAAPVTLLIQEAQAAELAFGPANASVPVVVAGDFNADAGGSDPTIATYQLMIGAGFGDAWAATHPGDPGFTWGQLPDYSNVVSLLHQRIDYIFFRGNIRALASSLAGEATHDRIDGLWPSDHAGVRATLLIGLE